MYEGLVKSLQWLSFMFPETHPAQDDADRMSNNIHLYCTQAADAIEVLSKEEAEEAEEQGLLVRLPCKVGDTVWSRDVEPWTVVSVEWFSKKVTQLHCKSPVTGRGMTFSVGKRSLGKTVFLTREEAEAALKGEKEQDDCSRI